MSTIMGFQIPHIKVNFKRRAFLIVFVLILAAAVALLDNDFFNPAQLFTPQAHHEQAFVLLLSIASMLLLVDDLSWEWEFIKILLIVIGIAFFIATFMVP